MKCNFELLFTKNGIYKYFKKYIKNYLIYIQINQN